MANLIVNVTNGTIVPLGPSDFYMVLADVVVPPNSTVFAVVDFALPVDQSAVMTVVEAHVVSFYFSSLNKTSWKQKQTFATGRHK